MKKLMISTLTSALVIGAVSTTFASVNPFSDVPSEHWAYDAVSQLAKDGVIEGYGDDTFKGEQNITRYEMAQMIAKAMAKTNVDGSDKALIDKLSTEFADELNNLGVRVDKLEKNADNVKWNGEARYTYTSQHPENEHKINNNKLLLRLEPSAEVNNNWHVNARLDANYDVDSDTALDNTSLKRVWIQGDFSNSQVKAGKLPSTINKTLVFDNEFSGGAVKFTNNNLALKAEVGRLSSENLDSAYFVGLDTGNYNGASIEYNSGKFGFTGAYQNFDLASQTSQWTKNNGVWSVGAAYNFDNNIKLSAQYAESTKDLPTSIADTSKDDQNKAYDITAQYKGAIADNQNTWGVYTSYRYIGSNVGIAPTYDSVQSGLKGWQFGTNYTFLKGVVGTAEYGHNKNLATGRDHNILFGRLQFLF